MADFLRYEHNTINSFGALSKFMETLVSGVNGINIPEAPPPGASPRRILPQTTISGFSTGTLEPTDILVTAPIKLGGAATYVMQNFAAPVVVQLQVAQDDTGGRTLTLPQVRGDAPIIGVNPGDVTTIVLSCPSGSDFVVLGTTHSAVATISAVAGTVGTGT